MTTAIIQIANSWDLISGNLKVFVDIDGICIYLAVFSLRKFKFNKSLVGCGVVQRDSLSGIRKQLV
jgi:hypothetical protein